MRSKKTVVITLAMGLLLSFQSAFPQNMFWRRSITLWVNGSSDAKINQTIGQMRRAEKAGYNMFFADDARFKHMSKLGNTVLGRYRKLHAESKKLGMEMIPMSFGQLDASSHNRIHAEAFPVKGTNFTVTGNQALPVENPGVEFANTGFEAWKTSNQNVPMGWQVGMLAPGTSVFCDKTHKKSGNAALRIEIPSIRSAALYQNRLTLKPYRAYRISAWIKTANVKNPRCIGFEVWGGGMWLLNLRDQRGVTSSTADWKRYSWDFNSLHATNVNVRMAVSAFFTTTGTVWFDDVRIEEIGLEEMQTRINTPVTVKSQTGKVYVPDKDYAVEKGSLAIPAGSAIKNGETLEVDWYQIAAVETWNPPAAFCTPEVWTIYETNGRLLNENLCGGQAKSWHLKPSEWRIGFWDPTCQATYPHSGAYLGAVQKRFAEIAFGLSPELQNVYCYNDSYDPYHNARANYPFPFNGGKLNSWQTMHCRTIVFNWNVKHKKESLYFYAGKDTKFPAPKRPQLLAANEAGLEGWLSPLEAFEKDYPGEDDAVIGVGFCTYTGKWDGIELLAQRALATGRWATNKDPFSHDYDWGSDCSSEMVPKPQKVNNDVASGLSLSGKTIRYSLVRSALVELHVTSLSGQQVHALPKQDQAPGSWKLHLGKLDLASGIYFVRLDLRFADGTSRCLVKKAVWM